MISKYLMCEEPTMVLLDSMEKVEEQHEAHMYVVNELGAVQAS